MTSFDCGFVLFPEVTLLDLAGPAQVLSRMSGACLHFIAETADAVTTDTGLTILPTATYGDCPPLDVICVPGGGGTVELMQNVSTLRQIRKLADETPLVTSVCTGSLVLAAAGLLIGFRAASHWAWRDKLALFGAIPVHDRVVFDRNRITGGGVTAGIDWAFAVVEHVRGRDEAAAIRLALEYAPDPMTAGGTPETARPEILAAARARIASGAGHPRVAAIEAAAARMVRPDAE